MLRGIPKQAESEEPSRKRITSKIKFKGYTVHASKERPQYLIKSDKTDHMAMHKGSALTKLKKTTK